MEKNKIGFMGACKQFFGFQPGQTLTEFRNEMAKLTDQDKRELSAMLIERGIDHEPVK